MADSQEDDLPQLASLDSGDFIRIVENQATTPVSSIISRALFKAYLDTLYEPIGGGGTGWQAVTETWTRTGNHTFTVSGDLTAKYLNAKVRYKDGGSYEYGVVTASTFSSPNTTNTLITNTSYLMAAATITDMAISYQESPQGWPHWFNWDAAPAGFSVVPSSPVYRWMATGRMLTINYNEPNNGTSNATTFTATLPVGALYAVTAPLGTTVDNSVVLTTPGRAVLAGASSTVITFRKDTASAAWTGSGGKRAVITLAYEF